jgi:hypothetical protein
MYVDPDFKTKKELKEAVQSGKRVKVFSPGPYLAPANGRVSVEGPHGVHKWYASCTVADGFVTEVK